MIPMYLYPDWNKRYQVEHITQSCIHIVGKIVLQLQICPSMRGTAYLDHGNFILHVQLTIVNFELIYSYSQYLYDLIKQWPFSAVSEGQLRVCTQKHCILNAWETRENKKTLFKLKQSLLTLLQFIFYLLMIFSNSQKSTLKYSKIQSISNLNFSRMQRGEISSCDELDLEKL